MDFFDRINVGTTLFGMARVLGMAREKIRVVAYYQSHKMYENCPINAIDPKLCTDLIFTFAGINRDGTIKVIDPHGHLELGGFTKFNQLKTENSDLRTHLAIGGWSEEFSRNFSTVAASRSLRRVFIGECVSFVAKYGFDGIDLDWEFPEESDKPNFTVLVAEMAEKFKSEGLYLSAAIAPAPSMINRYDVPKLSKYLHFINLMTYDLNVADDGPGRAGHNAPLYSQNGRSVSACVEAWINAGADPNKLNLGVPAYGRTYILRDARKHEPGDDTVGPGNPKTVDYTKILEMLKTKTWSREWDYEQRVPYLHKDRSWVSYDDTDSVKEKIDYAKAKGLGGMMLWSLDADDPPKFPILRTFPDTY